MDYRENLIEKLRDVGQDLYEHPEQFVPEKRYNTDFDIWIHFPQNFHEPVKIEITAEYYPDKVKEDAKKYSSDEFFGRTSRD